MGETCIYRALKTDFPLSDFTEIRGKAMGWSFDYHFRDEFEFSRGIGHGGRGLKIIFPKIICNIRNINIK